MTAEHKVVKHVDQVEGVVLVLLPQVLQDSDLFLGLTVETFLVPDHFQGDMLMALVIEGFYVFEPPEK